MYGIIIMLFINKRNLSLNSDAYDFLYMQTI